MRKLLILALVAGQVGLAAQPAAAAELLDDRTSIGQQRGAFAGTRLRVPLGGKESGQARVALTLTPVSRSQLADGTVRTRFAEGAELSLNGKQPATLRLGGVPISGQLSAQGDDEHPNQDREDRTGKKILKGAAVVAIVAAAVVGGLFLFLVVACDDNRCSE